MPALKRKRKEPSLDLITNMDSDTMLEMLSFLNHIDRRKLSQTCKRMREIVVENGLLEYHLNDESSYKYYTENRTDSKLRKRASTIKGVGRITKFQLNRRDNVVDLQCLQGVNHIRFWYCKGIVDLNPISTSQTVEIRGCKNIKNIGMLGNVNTLSFHGDNTERNIAGFSLLNNVENIFLYICHSLKNEDILKWNPRKLVLHRCSLITDMPRFSNIHYLELDSIKVTDLSPLANVHILKVRNCNQATKFSALGAVRALCIHFCDNLAAEDLPFLSNVPKLSLKTSKNLASAIPSLSNQDLTVEFHNCETLTSEDLNYLVNVSNLNIYVNESISNVDCLASGRIKEISLVFCRGLTSVSALSTIPLLKIQFCRSITDWGSLTPIKDNDLNKCVIY